MFNENIKNLYLEIHPEVQLLFSKVSEMEVYKRKDLYEFEHDEIQELNLNNNELRLAKDYVTWCIVKGYAFSNINVFDFFVEDDD